ncbi:MAG TPA: radical SAM protein [Gemmataceae bacterium]|nr:radical SAM protein [Gemmataceae bacterium]
MQLPIPPLGPGTIRGNVPLAAGYLKLFAEQKGLGAFFEIAILPARSANTLGDQALVEGIVQRRPWMVGFTCYVWNIERTLWIARELKRRLPDLRIVLGGPEITPDNAWVLETADYDFAVIGEGEQTFAQLLLGLLDDHVPPVAIAGLYVPPSGTGSRYDPARRPAFRTPLPDLNLLGSPYLAGILDAAEEEMLLLETTRGCVFKCKFCYYPKSYDKQYYLSKENILANLSHAVDRAAREVFLLDPTLNQRKDFADLLRTLAQGNPGRQFSYFGELRGEGLTEETAGLLREANFTEVEVGLQSIDAEAQTRMDRKNNLKAFERGVRALMAQDIAVKVDLIVGLPGDTADSVRRGMRYLRDNGLYSDVQVFNLSILPGTAFRQEAGELGLKFQPRPPYYVLQTPTLGREELYGLMQEAQDLFDIEFDAQPPPVLDFEPAGAVSQVWRLDLDRVPQPESPSPDRWAQTFTLWMKSSDFHASRDQAIACIRHVLDANPFTTLQVVLDLSAATTAQGCRKALRPELLQMLAAACLETTSYLDRYYAMQPGGANGAKRLIAVLPAALRAALDESWLEQIDATATVVWRRSRHHPVAAAEIEPHEYAWIS